LRLPRPTVYEINTAVWLTRLGRDRGRPLTLAEVPGAEWDALAALPVDAIWLMGVWERSPAGLAIARTNPELDAGNRAALVDLRDDDVIGSPYCVRDYLVDERFGAGDALAGARRELADRGLGLILDYVPNHVAPDHPWLSQHPDCFVPGSQEELERDPNAFLQTAAGVVANGRDPYFPPWPDVVQLNAFSPALRQAVVTTLITIGGQCDGLRCDMAMLMTNEVFARTWGERVGSPPERDYWPDVIAGVRDVWPDLLFIAEAYWDMEWTLQQQGFDLCYDKRLYDRLVHESAEQVRGHLEADVTYQGGLIRFIENHDEPRAAATFAAAKARAAAVVMSTLEGARLYHDGQFDGRTVRIPVFLTRGPEEPSDPQLRSFYELLLRAVSESGLHDGDWSLCGCTGWPDNASYRELVSWCWSGPSSREVVVVNLSDQPAQARVHLPWQDELRGRAWVMTDRLTGQIFRRDGDELAADGLYVGLDGWAQHFLTLTP
jgi:Alpha amylase, catalytic domain